MSIRSELAAACNALVMLANRLNWFRAVVLS